MQSSRTWKKVTTIAITVGGREKTKSYYRLPIFHILIGGRPVLVEGGEFGGLGAGAVVNRLVVQLDGLGEQCLAELVVALVLELDRLLEGRQRFLGGGWATVALGLINCSGIATGSGALVNGHGFAAVQRLFLLLVAGGIAGRLSVVEIAEREGDRGAQQQRQLPPGERGSCAARRHGELRLKRIFVFGKC